MREASEALGAALEALRVTRGNIRSLGPAGALGDVWPSYRIWLAVVEDAIAKVEAEHDRR